MAVDRDHLGVGQDIAGSAGVVIDGPEPDDPGRTGTWPSAGVAVADCEPVAEFDALDGPGEPFIADPEEAAVVDLPAFPPDVHPARTETIADARIIPVPAVRPVVFVPALVAIVRKSKVFTEYQP